jgi:TP53 regulating kinase-like protein
MEIIAQGAEAVIRKDGKMVVKDRIEKPYRHPELDLRLRKRRTRKEAKLLEKAARICQVPGNVKVGGTKIFMDFIDKKTIAKNLTTGVCEKLGEVIAKLHGIGVTHGDLTTSNVLEGPVIIDFGLAKNTHRVEDFAMDIHLFKSCLTSRHPSKAEECFDSFWRSYSKNFERSIEVIHRIENIEKRGRYHKRK